MEKPAKAPAESVQKKQSELLKAVQQKKVQQIIDQMPAYYAYFEQFHVTLLIDTADDYW